ncbi:hypothetical protein UQW22_09825 [Isoptericola halotolerans]|uniref:hypothetical protein n=1 Tax=Isoptericola halotolerans TaxID=300560 RepID=UPI00388DF0D0
MALDRSVTQEFVAAAEARDDYIEEVERGALLDDDRLTEIYRRLDAAKAAWERMIERGP